MKKYNSLYAALLITLTITFPALSMDLMQSSFFERSEPSVIDLSQSTFSEPSFSEKQKKEISKILPLKKQPIKKQPISFLQQKSTQKRIKSLSEQIENIDKLKQEKYKPIIDDISSKLQTPKKLTKNKLSAIDYTLKIINGETINKIIKDLNQQPIGLKNKLSILTDLYNLPQPASYKELESSLYKKPTSSRDSRVIQNEQRELSSWLEKKIEIAREIDKLELQFNDQLKTKLQKEEIPLKALRTYKTHLEASIAQLKNSKNPEKIAKKETYQELLSTVSHQINLFTEIDQQILVDYTHFTINKLFDYLELLGYLRKNLNNEFSERYNKLDQQFKTVQSYQELKLQQRRDEQKQLEQVAIAEQQRLAEQERLEQEQQKKILESAQLTEKCFTALGAGFRREVAKDAQNERITTEDRNKILNALKNYEEHDQQIAEEQRLEQERLNKLIRSEEEKQQNKARLQYQEREARRLERELLEQANIIRQQRLAQERQESQKWIPWITTKFTAIKQTVVNFFSYLRLWWPF